MRLKNWRGIYGILNNVTGQWYIGSTKDAEIRRNTHFRTLSKGAHHNMRLQDDFNTYGEESFSFELIQELLTEVLLEVEQQYLYEMKPYYNIGLHASGGDNLTNHPDREDIIRRMTETLKSRYEGMTPEERKAVYGKPGERNPNWKGGVSTPDCLTCGKRIGPRHVYCNKCRPRSGEDNPFHGKKHSEATRQKLREQHIGVYKGKQNKPIIVDGCKYRSAGQAGKDLGIQATTVRWRCRSENPKFNGYKYEQ
tara:strand:+ start:55 stop:810 length:756 start_codon:yes stop_codon:yes gene_type:complete